MVAFRPGERGLGGRETGELAGGQERASPSPAVIDDQTPLRPHEHAAAAAGLRRIAVEELLRGQLPAVVPGEFHRGHVAAGGELVVDDLPAGRALGLAGLATGASTAVGYFRSSARRKRRGYGRPCRPGRRCRSPTSRARRTGGRPDCTASCPGRAEPGGPSGPSGAGNRRSRGESGRVRSAPWGQIGRLVQAWTSRTGPIAPERTISTTRRVFSPEWPWLPIWVATFCLGRQLG